MSNREVVKKYGVLKSMLSTRVKHKENLLKSYEAGHTKLQKLKTAEFENIDLATHKRFLSNPCENVHIIGLIVQTQALEFAKKA